MKGFSSCGFLASHLFLGIFNATRRFESFCLSLIDVVWSKSIKEVDLHRKVEFKTRALDQPQAS